MQHQPLSRYRDEFLSEKTNKAKLHAIGKWCIEQGILANLPQGKELDFAIEFYRLFGFKEEAALYSGRQLLEGDND